MSVTIKINENSILEKVRQGVQKKGDRIAYEKAYSRFYRAKTSLLRQFDSHLVTIELNAGANSPTTTPNISNTLDGYGNLYAFIGFNRGENPIEPLRALFENQIKFRRTSFRNNNWYFSVSFPSWDDIEEKTQMPWEQGNSWAKGIEEGMSNLSFFLNKKAGRSGGGIMIKGLQWEVNDDLQFQPTPYLSEILENFREKFNKV